MDFPTHWRLRHVRYRLLGTRCVGCDQPVFPPRPLCPVCTSLLQTTSALTGLEVVGDYPFGKKVIGNRGLQEVDLTVDYPNAFDRSVIS